MAFDLSSFDAQTKGNLLQWLEGPYDEKSKEEIRQKLISDPKGLEKAFSQSLSFGTAGIRGIMGIGTSRLNLYTIRLATQGLARYLKKQKIPQIRVLIGFDNRKNSFLFAQEAAQVLAANNIKVFIFKELRPTPLVSFGCRYKECLAAIMITASHNPPEYNGFKVYWSDGAQILPPHDLAIIQEVNSLKDISQVHIASLQDPHIHWIEEEIDKAYLSSLSSLKTSSETAEKKSLNILYTNLHGTGITLIPKALKDWGFSSLSFVEPQTTIDENFSFAPIPNPEDPKTLQMGIEFMKKRNSDIFLASDPDADRLGVVVAHQGKEILLSGNQIACLLLFHLCQSLEKEKKIPPKGAAIKSIVTSELFCAIANSFHLLCFDVLTGFKYIAEKMRLWEKEKNAPSFIFGAEESYGFLAETFVRDKDAISASCLICEAALMAKKEKKTLVDKLYDLYHRYGVFREKVLSFSFEEGKEGLNKIQKIMGKLRKNPPSSLASFRISAIEDYQRQISTHLAQNTTSPILLPKSDVLRFWFEDQSKIVIRPSGTEPKLKIYAEVIEKNFPSVKEGIEKADFRLQAILSAFQKEL